MTESKLITSLMSKVSECEWLDTVKTSWITDSHLAAKIEQITSQWGRTFDDLENNNEAEIAENLQFYVVLLKCFKSGMNGS